MDLPTGTVTFLFTDIEGSTRRWEANAPLMRRILLAHDTAMRQAIACHRGHVFKTIGDAFCVVFARAEDAVHAALDAQRALAGIDDPEAGPVRVRMAVHTGEADERDGDYFGPSVNRVARLLAVAHGQQVLLSSTTRDIVLRWLGSGVGVRDLGRLPLRDLDEPEHVFQLTHDDLRADFPSPRGVQASPNNLPRQLSSFVGRARELDELAELVRSTSVLTLTGSGGCGKTRLALQLAERMLPDFPDGVWWVALAPISDGQLVPSATLEAMGLREQTGKPVLQSIVEHLQRRRVLLILDNCEHLLDACAALVEAILKVGADDKVIVTSREALGISGETAYRVPSMSFPPRAGATRDLMAYESVALFVERARSAKPEFRLTDASTACVARICRRLDGIPLALELAAARVKVLSVEQIDARLDDRFRLLTGGRRAALERHQTLRAAIAWSYEMLNPDEKALLRGLGAFAGGWTMGSALAVCRLPDASDPSGRALDEFEMLDLLSHLVDKSLVVVDEPDASGEVRYRLLETVRQFMQEEAISSGDANATRDRHLRHFLDFASSLESRLIGRDSPDALRKLDAEQENLLAALQWAKSVNDGGELGLRMALSVARYWDIRGEWTVGIAQLGELLELADRGGAGRSPSAALVARALNAVGWWMVCRGELDRAEQTLSRSLSMTRDLDDRRGQGNALNNLCVAALRRHDYAIARERAEQTLGIRRELGEPATLAIALNNLALVASAQGDFGPVRAWCEEALELNRSIENRFGMAMNLGNLGNLAAARGDTAEARRLLEQALAINRELSNRPFAATNLRDLARSALRGSDATEAEALARESLSLGQEIDDAHAIAESELCLASVLMAQDRCDEAVEPLRAALRYALDRRNRALTADAVEQASRLSARAGRWIEASGLIGLASGLRAAIGAGSPPIEQQERDRFAHQVRERVESSGGSFDEGFDSGRATGSDPSAWNAGASSMVEQALVNLPAIGMMPTR